MNVTSFAPRVWDWAGGVSLDVQQSGVYTVNVWMREDGLRVDRLLLTTDTAYLPADFGPAETVRQTEASTGTLTALARAIDYGYDGLYHLTSANYATGEAYQYAAYDPVGNRLQQIIDGDTTEYLYDAANRLAAVDGVSYSFDDNGNLLTTGSMTNTWDAANRLIEANRNEYTLESIYNGVGDRVGQTVGVTTTHFALDVQGLPEVIHTSDGNAFLHLPGVIVTESAEGEQRYLLSDGLGSVRQAVDENAEIVSYYEFDPYGSPVPSGNIGGEPYGYTGEWYESYIHLLFLRARWYAPETGTFLSVDPVETEPPYAYVRGNVVNLVDPSGLCAAGTCGPDMTEWLMEEMRRHVNYGLDVKNLRDSMLWQIVNLEAYGPKLGTIHTETPFTEIIDSELLFDLNNRGGTTAVDAVGVLEYALYGLAVDYTNVNFYNFERDGLGTCGNRRCLFRVPKPGGEGVDDHRSMTLCGKCIDVSDIGNMMFGAGGNGRGYNLAFVFGSAQVFNILNDVLQPASRMLFDQISNPFTEDPRGAISGWFLAQSTAYVSQNQFCSVLENWDWINYRDNASLAATCPACETDRLKVGSGHTIGPGNPNRSLFAVSDDRSVLDELRGRLD